MWIRGTCEILRRGPGQRWLPRLGRADAAISSSSVVLFGLLWLRVGLRECFLGMFLLQQKRCWLCKESWCCIRAVTRSSVMADLWNNRPSVPVWMPFTQHVRPTVYFQHTLPLIVEAYRSLHMLQSWRGEKLRDDEVTSVEGGVKGSNTAQKNKMW